MDFQARFYVWLGRLERLERRFPWLTDTRHFRDSTVTVFAILFFRVWMQFSGICQNPQPCIQSYHDSEFSSFNGSEAICSFYNNFIQFTIDQEVRGILYKKPYTDLEKNCIKTKVNESLFAEKLSKQIINDQNLTSPEKRATKIDAAIEDFLFHCIDLSESYDLFGQIFDGFKKIPLLDGQLRDQKDFCFKKYFEDNQLIRSDFDLMPINAFAVTEYELFCRDTVIDPIKKNVIEPKFWDWIGTENILKKPYKLCVIDEIEISTVLDKLMAIGVAASMGMTDEQKNVELRDFDRICRRVIFNIRKNCN